MLIDSHCHFDFPAFEGQQEAIWQQCQQQHIQHLIIPGTEPEQWQRAIALKDKLKNISLAFGIHPWFLPDRATPEALYPLIKKQVCATNAVAIGECGLDGSIDTDMARQKQWFIMQIKLASELQLPLIIHAHKAHNDVIECLKENPHTPGGVIHAFSGSYAMAKTYWDMGFYLGVGGTITYPRASKTRATLEKIPLEALLLETDAPDMPLHGHQGKANSPLHLTDIAQTLAKLKNLPVQAVEEKTTANCQQLFQLPL